MNGTLLKGFVILNGAFGQALGAEQLLMPIKLISWSPYFGGRKNRIPFNVHDKMQVVTLSLMFVSRLNEAVKEKVCLSFRRAYSTTALFV